MTLLLIVLIGPNQLDQVPASARNILEWLNFNAILITAGTFMRHRPRAIRRVSSRAASGEVTRSLTCTQMFLWPN